MSLSDHTVFHWGMTILHSPKEGSCPMVPTAIGNQHTHYWQLWISSLLYFIIGIGALFGFIQAIRSQGTYYFRVSFLGVSSLLCLVRGVQTLIYLKYIENHMFSCYLFDLFIPVYLQYWTYSLLILFVWRCQLIIQEHENWVNKFLYPIYHGVQFILLVLCFTTSWALGKEWRPNDQNRADWDRRPALYVALLYLLLCSFGLVFATRAYNIIELATTSMYSKSRLRFIGALMSMYLLLFFLRFLWNITYYLGHNPAQTWINDRYEDCNTKALATSYLLFYGVFEIIPSAVVVCIVTMYIKPKSVHSSPSTGKKYPISKRSNLTEKNSYQTIDDEFVDVSFYDSHSSGTDKGGVESNENLPLVS